MRSSFSSAIARARNLMAQPDCIAVSFDVFDTLLIRPGILPLDVLFFMLPEARKIVSKPAFDFIVARNAAENIARAKLALAFPDYGEITLDEIYNSLAEDFGLSATQKDALMAAEIETEVKLLKRNECAAKLFDEAKKLGKKILIISDIYLGREVVAHALAANEFEDYSQLYVSSEIKKRKDTRALFEHVLKNEGLRPEQLLHIGDNPLSDFEAPRGFGITACLLPKALDVLHDASESSAGAFRSMLGASVESRLLMGFGIKKLLSAHRMPLEGESLFGQNPFVFGYLGIGPFLMGIVQSILQNKYISERYFRIHFASRDGFLPLQAYREMAAFWPKALPADYLYCGRRAYDIHKFEGSCVKYLMEETGRNQEDGYSVRNFLDAMFSRDFYKKIPELSSDVLDGSLRENREPLAAYLQSNATEIDALLDAKKKAASAYYSEKLVRNDDGRAVVFDLGYNGPMSVAIGRLTSYKVDKIYVWQTDKNIERDKANGTFTYALIPEPERLGGGIPRGNVLLEEVFSSLETSCIGFTHTKSGIAPLFDDDESVPEEMRQRLLEIQRGVMTFIRDAIVGFSGFLPNLFFGDIEELLIPLRHSVNEAEAKDLEVLAPIAFADKFFQSKTKSLRDKIIEIRDMKIYRDAS